MSDQFIYALTDTWNNVATTFAAIGMNVTDTASAADSKLLDMRVDGVPRFTVNKSGHVVGATFAGNLTGNVTGGTVAGLSAPIAIADGGTGGGTAAAARTALGVVARGGDTMTGALQIPAGGSQTNAQLRIGSVGTGLYAISGSVFVTIGDVQAFRIDPAGPTAAVANVAMTREKGDARYAPIASGAMFKELIADAAPVDLSGLSIKEWVWGGELAEDDPRRGKVGRGLLAGDVASVLPQAVVRDDQGRPAGLDPLTLIGALLDEVNALRQRIAALEDMA
jgi:hypothetical protein